MIPASPGAEFLTFGSFSLLWYSITALAGAAVGISVILLLAKRNAVPQHQMIDTVFWVLVVGLLGARLYHVWNEWWWYQDHVFDIWHIWEGGMAIHGGIVFGVSALIFLARQKHISFLRFTDLFAPGLIIAQAIGRWGNYFNEELFGTPYTGFLALEVSPAGRPSAYALETTFYPLFLYEFILNGLLFVGLLVLAKRTQIGSGYVTSVYLLGYGIIRFCLDFLRFEQFGFWGMTIAQWVSIGMIAAGILLMVVLRRKGYNEG